MPRKYPELIDRIVANSRKAPGAMADECWEWTGAVTVNRSGMKYGTMTRRLKRGPRKGTVVKELAHRAVVRDLLGRRLTRRMVVMHLCNNSLCVNPGHLVGGTQRQNLRQCVADGRHASQRKVVLDPE